MFDQIWPVSPSCMYRAVVKNEKVSGNTNTQFWRVFVCGVCQNWYIVHTSPPKTIAWSTETMHNRFVSNCFGMYSKIFSRKTFFWQCIFNKFLDHITFFKLNFPCLDIIIHRYECRMRCHNSTAIFPTHSSPVMASSVGSNTYLYSAPVTVATYAMLCSTRPRYKGILLYLPSHKFLYIYKHK